MEHLERDGPDTVVLITFPGSLGEYGDGALRLLGEVGPPLREHYEVARSFGIPGEDGVGRLRGWPGRRVLVLRRKSG